ncbi:LysR family transcriptional regulator ArgP [Donghicola sp. XS_ASV15]|uniref:LysR family transcriptional regulator ArgP n=1 Tax=Donghicola sp. XS_ASV15 TaxID=3241295 RepID=UPI003514C927
MIDPLHLQALAAVHRRGSFGGAAAELHLTQSAVSQRIKALEDQIGSVLLVRGTPCFATQAGQTIIGHFDRLMLMETAVRRDLGQGSQGPSTLRIAVNADSLATWFLPALQAVEGVLFDIVIDDEDVSQDWLKRGEVAAVVTAHAKPLQGCESVSLGHLRYVATASPDYMRRWMPDGLTAQALAEAPALMFSDKDKLQEKWVAQNFGNAVRPRGLPCHRIGSSQAFVEACILGLGWALNPEYLVADHLTAGRLLHLYVDAPHDAPLFWQFNRLTAEALAPMTAAVRAAAAQVLLPPD